MMVGMRTGLDPEQEAAVLAPRGPVCVLAGAGTGKTRTITHRIGHLVETGHVSAGQVLAVTFTARAAGELRSRLRALGLGGAANLVQAKTFHAAALRQLKYFWPQVIGDHEWQLLDSKFAIVGSAANRVGLATTTEAVRDLAGEIEWAKASLIAPENYAAAAARAHREIPADAAKIADAYAQYEELKTRNEVMLLDFDDLLLHTAGALEGYPAVAQEFRDRYRCFVVDEYQDVTPLQQRVLEAWLGERDDLTVVGDANQTIFSFTGATPKYLLDFSRKYPEAAVVRLTRDYRSTPQVVSLANRVIGAARGRIAGTRLTLEGQRPPGPPPVFTEYDDEPAEAAGVAREIRKLIENGVAASEIAILYRINAQSEAHEQALTELDVPYQVRGGELFFHRAEVRQAVRELQKAHGRANLPADAVGVNLPNTVRAVLAPVGLTTEEPGGAQARERWSSLLALVELTEQLVEHDPALDLGGLLHELQTRSEARHPPTVQGVTLASLHAAKGLEWDAVFLVGLTDGTVPILHAKDEAAIEEERRLLYVGVTRAREHLHLSWALARAAGGRASRKRSRFLASVLPDEAVKPTKSVGAQKKLPRCRVCGNALQGATATMLGRCEDCPGDLDAALFERLQAWRKDRSRELSVPAYVVFTDVTLTAIAEQRPTDVAALVAIPGIGAKKLERFGDEVLAVVADRGSA